MSNNRIGIIACASMHTQIKQCIDSIDGNFKIYPLVPPCTFNLKVDLIRYYFDKSTSENNITILAYGLCHPHMSKLINEYGERVIRLEGSNCYEMFLGTEVYSKYHKERFWFLNKPFFTRFKKDLLAGYELTSYHGKMLIKESFKKILALDFEDDPLNERNVQDFADEVALDYVIHEANIENLQQLLKEAISKATSYNFSKSRFPIYITPEKTEVETILESIDEIIYKINIHSRKFTYISPKVISVLGYTPLEFIDIMNEDISTQIYFEEDRNVILSKRYHFLVKSLNKGLEESFEIEYRMLKKDMDIIWVQEKIFPVLNPEGNIIHFIGKIADISDRKRLEEELRNSEERFRNIFESSPIGIILYNDANEIIEANRGALNIFDVPSISHLNGLNIIDVLNISKDKLSKLNSGESISIEFLLDFNDFNEMRLIKTKKSDKGYLKFYITPLYKKQDNKLVGHLVQVEDITERRLAEKKEREALKRSNFYRDLLAHDINNILNNIKSSAQLLNMWKHIPSKEEKIEEILEIMDNQVIRGTQLIKNVRTLPQVETKEMHLKSVNLISMINKAIDNVVSSIPGKIISIHKNVPPKKILVQGGNLLLDVFENILINGITHNHNKKIEIWIKVSIVDDQGKMIAKVEFKDNGIGIPDNHKEMIFKKEYKKEETEGMGIGLSLVEKILNQYRGEIEIENRVKGNYKEGSNFIIKLLLLQEK